MNTYIFSMTSLQYKEAFILTHDVILYINTCSKTQITHLVIVYVAKNILIMSSLNPDLQDLRISLRRVESNLRTLT